jgi:hypothetical protein
MSGNNLRRRLRFWLWCMEACERWGLGDSHLYYWCVRRAAACNDWRRH